jgi:hypothetical protein
MLLLKHEGTLFFFTPFRGSIYTRSREILLLLSFLHRTITHDVRSLGALRT